MQGTRTGMMMAEEGNQTFWTRTSETEGVGTATSAVMDCFAVTAQREILGHLDIARDWILAASKDGVGYRW